MTGAIRAAAANGTDFIGLYDALTPFLDPPASGPGFGPVAGFASGSLTSLYKIGAFFQMRLRDPGQRAALCQSFLREFDDIVDVMARDCLDALRQALLPPPASGRS